MNKSILATEVQAYIQAHLHADVHRLAMAKSPFENVSSKELAGQIAAKKKAVKKLPMWYNAAQIYYPALISMEQCSSEVTAAYKTGLAIGETLADLTGGFGVDSIYFAKSGKQVTHYEINKELSEIAAHNAEVFGLKNVDFIAGDGMEDLQREKSFLDTIYIDPARRSEVGKVFMLKDCTPNVVENLDLLLERSNRIIIKTSPLLDITAGINELGNVAEVHIISTKNECKELLFILGKPPGSTVKIVSTTLNEGIKQFSFDKGEEILSEKHYAAVLLKYLYEPDAALLKSGAFDLIAQHYNLEKLDDQTQLYTSKNLNTEFPGRIFTVDEVISMTDLKKQKELVGSVIVRSFPQKAEILIKKYKIKPDHNQFLIFTQSKAEGHLIIKATILQHY